MFDPIYKLFGTILKFFNQIGGNYVIALLLFAILVKIILFPLGIKQQKNSIKQAKLRPKEMAIRKKYAGRTDKPTQQKMNEEIMNLYQQEKYSPVSGCLPLLIQFPIIIMLYTVIRKPLQYLYGISEDVLNTLKELTGVANTQEQIKMIGIIKNDFGKFAETLQGTGIENASDLPDFSFFGFGDFSATPSFSSWYVLIPVLTFIFMFFGMKISRKYTYNPQAETGDAAKSMAIMDFTMPLMSVWISFIVPAVIGIYWIFQNVLGTLQQMILAKMYPIPQFTEEEYRQAEKEMNKNYKPPKKTSGEKKQVRSLHHIDDDDDDVSPAPAKKEKVKTEEQSKLSDMLGKPALKEDKNKDENK